MTTVEKQTLVEKCIFEHDTEFFKQNFKTINNEIKIFTQEYENISINYDNFMNDFTMYRSIKLKKLFNSDKTKNNAIIILLIIYMRKDRIIWLIFKIILDTIVNIQYLDVINKTVLLIKIAKYITKIFMLSSEDSEDNKNVIKSVKNICSCSELVN